MTITLNGTTGITNDGGYTGDGVSFADTTPSNTLVTTTGGNVGIGTSSPNEKVTIASSGAASYIQICDSSTGTTSNDGIFLGSFNGAAELKTKENNALSFGTNNTEAMRIDSSRNLLVGTTSNPNGARVIMAATWPINPLEIAVSSTSPTASAAQFTYNGTYVGQIQLTSTATSYITSSDYRLKQNIAPMTGALAKVSALKPVTYTWKSTGEESQGFIAHELQEVVPDCVTGEKDAVNEDGSIKPQGIDTSFLVATLTAAIQELKAELDTVKTELVTLKGQA
jgi:hypothetical protein